MYHVTDAANRENILKFGLDALNRISPWDLLRASSDDPLMLDAQPVGNYFTCSAADAWWYGKEAAVFENCERDIWVLASDCPLDNWIFDPEIVARARFMNVPDKPGRACEEKRCGHVRLPSSWYTISVIEPQWLTLISWTQLQQARQDPRDWKAKICDCLCAQTPVWHEHQNRASIDYTGV